MTRGEDPIIPPMVAIKEDPIMLPVPVKATIRSLTTASTP